MLNNWKENASEFFAANSAQGYFRTQKLAAAAAGACGSSCGAGDEDKDDKPKPSSCGADGK